MYSQSFLHIQESLLQDKAMCKEHSTIQYNPSQAKKLIQYKMQSSTERLQLA